MGVDYYECNKCGRGFRDDSDYCVYCDCGNHFCNEKCAQPEYEAREEDDDAWQQCVSCIVCRNEHCTDYALLEFLLKHFSISKKDAEKLYFKANPRIPKQGK